MTTVVFTCPLDGLALETEAPTVLGQNQARDSEPGRHLHLAVDAGFTCLNGHEWRCRDSLTLERVS